MLTLTHPSSLLVRGSADVGVIDCEDLISPSETLTGVRRRSRQDKGDKYSLSVLSSHDVEAQSSSLLVKDNLARLPVERFYIWCSNYTFVSLKKFVNSRFDITERSNITSRIINCSNLITFNTPNFTRNIYTAQFKKFWAIQETNIFSSFNVRVN